MLRSHLHAHMRTTFAFIHARYVCLHAGNSHALDSTNPSTSPSPSRLHRYTHTLVRHFCFYTHARTPRLLTTLSRFHTRARTPRSLARPPAPGHPLFTAERGRCPTGLNSRGCLVTRPPSRECILFPLPVSSPNHKRETMTDSDFVGGIARERERLEGREKKRLAEIRNKRGESRRGESRDGIIVRLTVQLTSWQFDIVYWHQTSP